VRKEGVKMELKSEGRRKKGEAVPYEGVVLPNPRNIRRSSEERTHLAFMVLNQLGGELDK
jgi:hypothetical protein